MLATLDDEAEAERVTAKFPGLDSSAEPLDTAAVEEGLARAKREQLSGALPASPCSCAGPTARLRRLVRSVREGGSVNLDPPRDVGCPERGAAPGAACRDARHEAARGRLRVVSATDTERRP